MSGAGSISSGIGERFLERVSDESSGQYDSDQHHDDRPEESDQRIQNPQIKETDDDKESIRLQAGEEILRSSRYHSHQYL